MTNSCLQKYNLTILEILKWWNNYIKPLYVAGIKSYTGTYEQGEKSILIGGMLSPKPNLHEDDQLKLVNCLFNLENIVHVYYVNNRLT